MTMPIGFPEPSRTNAPAASRLQPVHFDHADAPVHHRRRHRRLQGVHVAVRERARGHASREPRRLRRHHRLAVAIERARDGIRRREHFGDGLAEPARRRLPDQLASRQEHEHRRHDRQSEQRGDQLEPESRERQPAPPLDEQLDDVARQHEAERHQHRDVGDRERIEHDFAQDVRIQMGRAVGQADDRDEAAEEQDDASEDQARIVAERPPFGRRGGRRPARRQLRTRREFFDAAHLLYRRSREQQKLSLLRKRRDPDLRVSCQACSVQRRFANRPYGLLFCSSSISRLNSPTSRNWRYTEAKRT